MLRDLIEFTLSTRSLENFLDHLGFGIGVVLRVLPFPAGKLALGALVELAVRSVAAQPVAEEQHTVNLRAAGRENMQVDVRIWSIEQAMLVPVRLADAQHIAGSFQGRDVGLLVRRLGDAEQDGGA